MNIVEVKNLTKYYGKQRGIENVSLTIEAQEIFGLIGPNGAGKSTTIRTLLSLIKPTGGSATIFGLDCFKHTKTILKDIGYLPAEVFFYEDMKVIDFLRYSASFYKKDCEKRIHYLAKKLDLSLDRKIADLSYGNKKKVGILQGLIHQPKLIILDEPTGGLDPLVQQTFFNILKEENKKGATIIFSSHILGEVQRFCNRIAFVKDGSILRIDTMDELTADTYLKVTFKTPDDINIGVFNIPGVTNIKVSDNECSFFYKGSLNPIIKILGRYDLLSLTLEEPALEDIFMHYYQ